jgi:hypothetical protein
MSEREKRKKAIEIVDAVIADSLEMLAAHPNNKTGAADLTTPLYNAWHKLRHVLELLSAEAWLPKKDERVRLVSSVACLAPVGSEGKVVMIWEPTISQPARFCVDCEGYPPFVTTADNLEPIVPSEKKEICGCFFYEDDGEHVMCILPKGHPKEAARHE